MARDEEVTSAAKAQSNRSLYLENAYVRISVVLMFVAQNIQSSNPPVAQNVHTSEFLQLRISLALNIRSSEYH